ncbi:MAG TPA: hypothetical protein VHW90_09460 [Stellaceae bacterium]|jgi:hypothetical protein|nr:hypothetical protein [Stellaceae bacterium]
MMIFHIRAEALASGAPDAFAVVVAKDTDEALLLLRKDIDFSGYRLPPAEMIPETASSELVRRVLDDAAAKEKGVYAFQISEAGNPALPDAPPAAVR